MKKFFPLLVFISPFLFAKGERIAVFYQPGFPYYMTSWEITPSSLADFLREAGLKVDLLNLQDLSDPERFNAQRYSILIHIYGNSFPLTALENLLRFHKEGGSIISTGVPFCHPCLPFPAHWGANVPVQRDNRVRVVEPGRAGKIAIRIEKRGGDWIGIWSDRIEAKPGDTFTVSAWVKSNEKAGGEDRLFVRFFSPTRFISQDGPAIPKEAGEWTFVTKTVTAPPGTTSVDVSPQLREEGSVVIFDDFQLVRNGGGENLLLNPSLEEPGNIFIDLGHIDYFSHQAVGTGAFREPPREGRFRLRYIAESGLGLDFLPLEKREGWYQLLDERSLPPEDKVQGVIALYRDGKLEGYVSAFIHHNCPQFKGAIDMWAGTQLFSPLDELSPLLAQAIITAGSAFILREKGVISEEDFSRILERNKASIRIPKPLQSLQPIYLAPGLRKKGFVPKPKFPPDEVYVASIVHLPLEQQFAFLSLEGLANREKPRLYLILNDRDKFWLDWYQRRGLIKKAINLEDPWEAFRIFKDVYKGSIIYDKELYSGIHIAMMLASLEDLIVCDETTAEKLGIPVKEDLRGRWKKTYEAYEWAVENLLPQMDKRVVAFLYPLATNVWDYVVAFRVFCFWITGWVDGGRADCDPGREKQVIEEAYARLPVNIPVLGFPWAGEGVGIQEGPGVSLGSQFAKFTVASTFTNISFHSGIKVPSFPRPKPPRKLKLNPQKNYATFVISDGDNITCWWGGFQPPSWDRKERGTLPLGWTLGPTASEFIPGILLYYLENASPLDAFLCAVSGIGYMYPDEYASRYQNPDAVLSDFLSLTKAYIQRLGLQGAWTMGLTKPELIKKYALTLKVPLFPDYSRRGDMTYEKANYRIDSVPVFHALTNWREGASREEAIDFIVDQVLNTVKGHKPPCFVNIFIWNWGYDMGMLVDIKKKLEEKGFVFVRPDELANLYLSSRRAP